MSFSTNTRYRPTSYIKTLDIFPPTPPTLRYITQPDLNNTFKYIHTDIKSDFKATNDNITSIYYNIASILAICFDTNNNQNKRGEKDI